METKPTTSCPLCGMTLQASGMLTTGGATAPVFQCDACTRTVELFGAKIDNVALTFCRDADGRAVDPADGSIIREAKPQGPRA